MSGYNYSYQVFKKYLVDIFEFYEDTDFTRAFIYRKNALGKYLVEMLDFPTHTDKSTILDEAEIFIKELEKRISPPKVKKKKIIITKIKNKEPIEPGF